MNKFIVIPAYNEEKTIGKVTAELKSGGYGNIIVVDDGSTDNTFEIANKYGAIVLKHLINRGQGAALKTGIDFALSKGAEIIVTFDADGQHCVEDIEKLTLPVKKNEVEVTLGSRFLEKNSNTPLSRTILLKGSTIVQNLFYGINLTDAHNGFRVLSKSAAEKIEMIADRMEHASEIVGEIKKKKIKFKEIPVTIKYSQHSLKKGHGSILQALTVLFKMFVRKIVK